VEEGIIKGLYRLREGSGRGAKVKLLGSGTILREAEKAADELENEYGVSAEVWSVTSYQQLRADAEAASSSRRRPYVAEQLAGNEPIIAVTDYMKTVPEQVASWLGGRLICLGTDGYGMSDTRANLRRHFGVDARTILVTALSELAARGEISEASLQRASAAAKGD
jgi:pyruvate dehydrogenase E1 component